MKLIRVCAAFLPTLAVLSFSGCGGGGSNSIEGKVTLGGKGVSGEMTWIGSDKKEYRAPVMPDGSYKVLNVPAGEASITIKGMEMPAGPKTLPKDSPKIGTPLEQGVAPPAKYNQVGHLKHTVKGGKEIGVDFTLTP